MKQVFVLFLSFTTFLSTPEFNMSTPESFNETTQGEEGGLFFQNFSTLLNYPKFLISIVLLIESYFQICC